MARKKELNASIEANKQKLAKKVYESQLNGEANGTKARSPKQSEQTPASAGSSAYEVYDVGDLRAQLAALGLTLRDIPGDGNCLFRALGDQLDGHSMNHIKHRMDTVRYIIAHRGHFEPFIDVPFDRYMDNLSRPGTYAGHEALVAFARLHNVNIIIHQLNSPLWQIEGTTKEGATELHLSYHNGEHYSSVRHCGDLANEPAHVCILSQPPSAIPCCTSHSSSVVSQKPVTSHIPHLNASAYSNSSITHEQNIINSPAITQTRENFQQNEDDFQSLIDEVMVRSGCRDGELAADALLEHNGDADLAVDYLVSLSFLFEPIKGDETLRKQGHFNDDDDRQPLLRRRIITGRNQTDAQPKEDRRLPFCHLSRSLTCEEPKIINDVSAPENLKVANEDRQHVEEKVERDACDKDFRFLTL